MIIKKFFSFRNIILICILIFATFLRFYKIKSTLAFNGEMGYDYMTIKTFVVNQQIPLIGPRTSHEWLFIGPIFYWIFGLLMPMFNWNVAFGSYFFAAFGVIGVFVCYWVIKKLFGEKVALISSFVMSFSPLWIQLIHDARFNAMTAILFFPFYYFLVKSIKDKGKSLFILGLFLGVMFSFFPSPIILLPGTIVILIIYRKKIAVKNIFPGILGLIIPVIPWLIYNAMHKFEMLFNLMAWIPYRIMGFLGFYPKNTATPQVLQNNFVGLYTFFQQSYFQYNNIIIFVLFTAILVFSIKALKKNLPLQILMILSAVSYLGLFLHGEPPEHYYLVIYPVPIILFALFLEKLSNRLLLLAIAILAYLLVYNLKYYFSEKWFYVNTRIMDLSTDFVPYNLQEQIANYIANDAGPRKFSLARVGPFDYFGESFSLNYQYLLWNLGHKPDQTATLKYTIYEDTRNLPKDQKIIWIQNIAVVTNE